MRRRGIVTSQMNERGRCVGLSRLEGIALSPLASSPDRRWSFTSMKIHKYAMAEIANKSGPLSNFS